MFDVLEEFAAIFDYLSDKKYFKCENYGFLVQKRKNTQIKDLASCTKCAENRWIGTDAMEEGEI